ncbi:MAG: hypothetical protein ACM3PF_06925 [Bacteroidota bacterium]
MPRSLHLRLVLVLLFLIASHGNARATTLFGLVDTGELYASTNAGATWTIRATIPANDAIGIAAATTSLDLYLVTRSGSVYRSSDGGTTWAAVGTITATDVVAFTLTPGGAVLALTETGTLYRSTDGGISFAGLAALTGSNWVSLARGPLGRLYALTRTGEVAESQDYGATWTMKGAVAVSNAVSISRRGNDLYLLTGTGEVARSTNYGASWTTVAALTQSGMRALAGIAGSTLAAAAETGEVATSANGVTWTWAGAINQLHVVALGEDTPTATGVPDESSAPRFTMRAPYPNPSPNGSATFGFSLAGPDRIRHEVFDAAGRLRAVREEIIPSAGPHEIPWLLDNLPAGTYLVRMTTLSGHTASAKWSVVR